MVFSVGDSSEESEDEKNSERETPEIENLSISESISEGLDDESDVYDLE